MPFDERLAERIRRVLATRTDVEEKRMFGGIAFMIRGHMSCGIVRDQLMIRLDPTHAAELQQRPHARPMDYTGRPMRGFLFIDAPGVASVPAVRKWVGQALEFVDSLPPKTLKRRQ